MPKYLVHGAYSVEGTRGVIKEGGSARRDAVARLAESVGGKLESFYFAFGKDSFFVIVDLPDNESAAAVSMKVGAAGAATAYTVVLLTPEELDRAAKKSVTYRAPGT